MKYYVEETTLVEYNLPDEILTDYETNRMEIGEQVMNDFNSAETQTEFSNKVEIKLAKLIDILANKNLLSRTEIFDLLDIDEYNESINIIEE